MSFVKVFLLNIIFLMFSNMDSDYMSYRHGTFTVHPPYYARLLGPSSWLAVLLASCPVLELVISSLGQWASSLLTLPCVRIGWSTTSIR